MRRQLTVTVRGYRREVPLDLAQRRVVIEATLVRVARTGLRMCVIFEADDAVYCEPDGRAHRGDRPSGGIRLDDVEVVGSSA